MRNLFTVSFFCLLFAGALHGQTFTVFDNFSDLESRIQSLSCKTTVVINFWATWCGPCVEELPCFDELHEKYAGPNFEVWLVSLDFKSRLEKQFIPFLQKKQLKPEIILLADQDADNWIPKMHPDWEGTLPATVVLRGSRKALYPEQFENYEELEDFVLSFLKKTVHKVASVGSEGTR